MRAAGQETNSAPAQRSPRLFLRKLLRWTERLLASIGLCFVIYSITLELTVMTSNSMAPTLQGASYEVGDRILLEKVTGYWRAPKRWEIYFFYDKEGNPVAKRIVGLPGEKICIRENRIRINGQELEQPGELESLRYYAFGSLANGREVDCGPGYFVLGDASDDSFDSRYTGIVSRDQLRGRVWCIVGPRGRMGFVH